jgi:teichuronic acid biosynthesis glycosyltransferase TuaC
MSAPVMARAPATVQVRPGPAAAVRVLLVIPGDGCGATQIFSRRQADRLAGAGIETVCFHLRSRLSPFGLAGEWLRFRAEARRFRPHLIHADYGTVTALFAALAAGGSPLIVTYRGSDLNRSRWEAGARWWLARLCSQLAALRARRIVCVSRELRGRLWWRRGRAVVLPSGVDDRTFRPEPRPAARARLGWPAGERVILFNAGRDPRNKRLDLAQAAVEAARHTWSDLRLEIMRGETEPARVPLLMNASDCLLVTSDVEGSPCVVQEAMACALPVVSVEVGDVAERLEGVEPSRIVARDAAEIGRALAEITASPMRSNGPTKAGGLSFLSRAQHLRRVYLEALALETAGPEIPA